MAERISQDNFDTKILQAEGVAVADFYSDSCVPCKRISPLLAELEEAHENVYVGKVNVAYDTELAEKYEVICHVPASGSSAGRTSFCGEDGTGRTASDSKQLHPCE